MSGSAAKVRRRDLRRAVDLSIVQIIDQQSNTLRQLVEVSNRSVTRIDALERAVAELLAERTLLAHAE